MPHALWTGSIHFGLVTIPVKLHVAIREHTLHFNYLHREDMGRIRYERVCAVCGRKVDWKDTVRGYPHGKGRYVELSEDDLKKPDPEAGRALDIFEFVDETQIEAALFDTPYYLVPDKRGRHAYRLLLEALRRSGKVGIARMILSTREHLAALRPVGRLLVAQTMHWPDEVSDPHPFEVAEEGHPSAAEMKSANLLIEAMSARFEPGELKDHHREQLLALIEARARGQKEAPTEAKGRPATNVVDLVDVLRRSIARTRRPDPPPVVAAAKKSGGGSRPRSAKGASASRRRSKTAA
jgi:DNA end-binding protein Ku